MQTTNAAFSRSRVHHDTVTIDNAIKKLALLRLRKRLPYSERGSSWRATRFIAMRYH